MPDLEYSPGMFVCPHCYQVTRDKIARQQRWTILEELHAARLALGITQCELADMIEMHWTTVLRMEHGRNVMASTVLKMAEALGVSVVINPAGGAIELAPPEEPKP
jgi:transcriptional regulator with XRE-family HTH domain